MTCLHRSLQVVFGIWESFRRQHLNLFSHIWQTLSKSILRFPLFLLRILDWNFGRILNFYSNFSFLISLKGVRIVATHTYFIVSPLLHQLELFMLDFVSILVKIDLFLQICILFLLFIHGFQKVDLVWIQQSFFEQIVDFGHLAVHLLDILLQESFEFCLIFRCLFHGFLYRSMQRFYGQT